MHPYLNIAVRAARVAGGIITRYFEQLDPNKIFEKGINDFVTHVDKAAEQAIIEIIQKAYPHHAILGEETGKHAGEEDYIWIIDPLDGTLNYVHGFTQFAVSIAIKHKGQLEHAVVYDPISQDLYTATRGAGAQLNNRRIRVSNRTSLKGSLIGIAFPFQHREAETNDIVREKHWRDHLNILQTVMIRCSDTRKVGCASLNLAYVAAGRLDGFWEPGLKEWDIAAGALLVREAGGQVSDFEDQNLFLQSGNIVAAPRKVHLELLSIIQEKLAIQV